MVHKSTRAFLCCLLCLLIGCFSVGCFPDLGKIDNAEDYQKKFSDVSLIKSNLSVQHLSINDFYNDNALDFNNVDFVCPTEDNEYKYMAVFAGQDVSVQEFVVYLCSSVDTVVSLYAYKSANLPSTIATGLEDDFESYVDPDTGEEKSKLKSFDEPDKKDAIAQIKVSLKANNWESFSIKSWNIDSNKQSAVKIEKDNCLLFQFANNCIKYDDVGNVVKENDSISLRFTAMLIRVV